MFIGPDTTHRARKLHKCHWCGEDIPPGTNYVRWMYVDNGADTVKCHLECKEAWNEGSRIDYHYFAEEVGFGDHHRGCLCERGHEPCECGLRGRTLVENDGC